MKKILFMTFTLCTLSLSAVAQPQEPTPKAWQCVASTAGNIKLINLSTKDEAIYESDLISTAPTRIGAKAEIKNTCLAWREYYAVELVGELQSDESDSFANTLKTCNKLLNEHTECEQGDK